MVFSAFCCVVSFVLRLASIRLMLVLCAGVGFIYVLLLPLGHFAASCVEFPERVPDQAPQA